MRGANNTASISNFPHVYRDERDPDPQKSSKIFKAMEAFNQSFINLPDDPELITGRDPGLRVEKKIGQGGFGAVYVVCRPYERALTSIDEDSPNRQGTFAPRLLLVRVILTFRSLQGKQSEYHRPTLRKAIFKRKRRQLINCLLWDRIRTWSLSGDMDGFSHTWRSLVPPCQFTISTWS